MPLKPTRLLALALVLTLALAAFAAAASSQEAPPAATATEPPPAEAPVDLEPRFTIRRAAGAIEIDGDLSDPGWQEAATASVWYEIRPGDNVPPAVGNVAYLAYDERYLYAGFRFDDPRPETIRAPLGDHDDVPFYTDYGGVILDTRNDGKTAQMFLANPRGIQYDAVTNDATGEDPSPDFYWDSAGKITATGWNLELRIPFSSLRYSDSDPEQWGILLYRNHPRDFRYQYFTSRLPRGKPCFICNVKPLVGLEGLPSGSHWVAAPYLAASQVSIPEGSLGTPLDDGDPEGELGLDLKWIPNPDTAVDATVNPDFSQVEADVAQISANERFALFFPETRPFFLERIDLFATPIQAVYTRTFTSPRWGVRSTGEVGGTAYTLLVGEDRGGGSVILPGPLGSSLANQELDSWVGIGRVRRDFGRSFVSFLYSGRELDGGGFNRVVGPDFDWRPTSKDEISGQLLWSESRTPERPDLAGEWDGRELSGHAAELWWYRGTRTWDYFAFGQHFDEEFRADNGFVPQVGYRKAQGEIGYSFYPTGLLSRLRPS